MKLLIINGHQKYEGVAEGGLAELYTSMAKEHFEESDVEVITSNVDTYDIQDEIEKMLDADYIMMHTPVYWFGVPWTAKKYLDEVFNVGLAEKTLLAHDGRVIDDPEKQYGTAGKLKAKMFMTATLNAPENAFADKNQYLMGEKTLDDVLLPVTSIFKFCGAEILNSFGSYDVMKNPQIDEDKKRFSQYLNNIISSDK